MSCHRGGTRAVLRSLSLEDGPSAYHLTSGVNLPLPHSSLEQPPGLLHPLNHLDRAGCVPRDSCKNHTGVDAQHVRGFQRV